MTHVTFVTLHQLETVLDSVLNCHCSQAIGDLIACCVNLSSKIRSSLHMSHDNKLKGCHLICSILTIVNKSRLYSHGGQVDLQSVTIQHPLQQPLQHHFQLMKCDKHHIQISLFQRRSVVANLRWICQASY